MKIACAAALLSAGWMALRASADVMFLEPFNLKLGVSDEREVRAILGRPTHRETLPENGLRLDYLAPQLGLAQVQVTLAPDAGGTMRAGQVYIGYDQPRDAQVLRGRYRLEKPLWQQPQKTGSKICRAEFYESAAISHLQSASVSLLLCPDGDGKIGATVSGLCYLSPAVFRELAQRQGKVVGLAPAPDQEN